ncbi:MAG: hypothetical protein B6D39_10765 [Anaerolineae bacterium UTCFX2]|jgi:hypothetical protein|nr:MAG: hypothetical protein B6D39_10765 [Anaerolineae bacterium UTCFX2]
MQNSSALPKLAMLPVDALVPHEDIDPRRTDRLIKRVLEEGLLKNPPVVTEIPDSDRFVVLDGANRTISFQTAHIPHIVCQIVSYSDPGVMLDTWYHVVSGMPIEELESGLIQNYKMELVECTLEEARKSLELETALAYVISEKGVRKLIPSTQKIRDLRLLNDLVRSYRGKADIFRASNDIWEIQKPFYPEIAALVVFPRLQPADILHAAKNDYKVPSGITRHIIPARAININIPIGILMADWDIEKKREWLLNWWMERMGANSIRFYAESTFSFNE